MFCTISAPLAMLIESDALTTVTALAAVNAVTRHLLHLDITTAVAIQ